MNTNETIQKTKQYLVIAKQYVLANKVKIAIGAGVVFVALLIAALYIYNNPEKVVYKPINACDVFTVVESHQLLGKETAGSVTDAVVTGNLATSSCTFTDMNADQGQMKLAALVIRSGVNDEGVKANKDAFIATKGKQSMESVKGLGDMAYFDHAKGQLNVLKGRDWYRISYGVGATPEANTLDDAIKVARLVLQ